jgi:superfamily II DNA or RNA helicase
MQKPPFATNVDKPMKSDSARCSIIVKWTQSGVEYRATPACEGWLGDPAVFGADAELVRILGQLEDEGYAAASDETVSLAWGDFYRVAASLEHQASIATLRLPPIGTWRPRLSSRDTLADQSFAISIAGWLDPAGRVLQGNVTIQGAVITAGGRVSVLPEDAWRVVEAVRQFWSRPGDERSADSNRRAWSGIRAYAVRAGADMTDFLRKTVVLTPKRLRIDMRKSEVNGANTVEIQPTFNGAPSRWLEVFDRLQDVPERYDIPDGNGIVHVMLAPDVRTVLREIRRMPGRRIAGDRAESFLRNPFATLGPDAATVIDADEFERAREYAGVSFARFTARVVRDEKGYPYQCALMIEEVISGEIHSTDLRFEGPADLGKFVRLLEARVAVGAQCCHWNGYDLEILGDTPDQAKVLREAHRDMTSTARVLASEVFDLSRYSERVEGFGVEKPYYSTFIARKSDDSSWFPENVDFGLCYTEEGGGETVAVVLSDESLAAFRELARVAQEEGRTSFEFPGCPVPVAVAWANEAIVAIENARTDVTMGVFDPTISDTKAKTSARKGLVVKPNVDALDYEERRGALARTGAQPTLPSTLRSEIALKEHQRRGVAWLQHLWNQSPTACRGALLADDMGLGKTLQLLAFIAAAIEERPDIEPFLIVAPVSLLENWKDEIEKFFAPNAMRVLTLYGPALAARRVPRRELDEELVQGGATRLLTSGWLGDAQIVLTTYETLRDLEFSLAAQRWTAMICDEAQKLKNPNALVTRAAKKQNARFRIACTGTPVENTLTDIWCLFDFVQPGLLGALKEFGNRYRKPIEAETDEERERVVELRALIEPQILRRTKTEVAKDLPNKLEVSECRGLALSDAQRSYYADAVAAFRKRGQGVRPVGLQSPLGLLQYLRRLCSDPMPAGHVSSDLEAVSEVERRSPKMKWLMGQLRKIQLSGEKAIVFCEFRDLQRTLQRCISERLGVTPDVINGDTSADSANANNRQRRIKKFQENPGFGVIILSPLAVGFGVNIQAANHVIHFTRTWNPAKEDQATDRAYRIGQMKDVYVYYPVVVASDFVTFDEKLDKLLDWKRGLSTDMLNGAGDVSPADFGDLQAPDGGNAFGNELLDADDVRSMDAEAFEAFCALLWSKRGYPKTFKTPRVGDGGVDVVAIRGAEGVVIQCKSSSVDGKELGWEAVKDVVAGVRAYAHRYPGVTFAMVAATNQRFNGTARLQAQVNSVELVDADELQRLLTMYPLKRGELERFLLASWSAA